MPGRDDFNLGVKRVLAQRVGYICSNPNCRSATSGPHSDIRKSIVVGEAAHITAASEGGPRYNPNLTREQRASPENGIWLCARCASLVDRDEVVYPAELLVEWKRQAEDEQFAKVDTGIGQEGNSTDENEKLRLLELLMERSRAGFHAFLVTNRFEATVHDSSQRYSPKNYAAPWTKPVEARRGTIAFRVFSIRQNASLKIIDLIGGISKNRISIVYDNSNMIRLMAIDSKGNITSTTWVPKISNMMEQVCFTWDQNVVSLWWQGIKTNELILPDSIGGRWVAITSGVDIDSEYSASYIIKGARGGGGTGIGLCASDKSLQLVISDIAIWSRVLSDEDIRDLADTSAAEVTRDLLMEYLNNHSKVPIIDALRLFPNRSEDGNT
jgi:hypothetical protein